MAKIRALCGLIHSKYDFEIQLAREIGWSKQRLNRITTGAKEPDLSEVYVLSKALNVPFEQMANIFLQAKSPNGQQSNRAAP